ncbi:putative chromatin remodeling complex subunit [Diplodia seriata]|uniref:Putative chromatin remodeling complex subunit n=1 Tax=Diplodia seriata TaxID=420778 RepID=A0A0G2DVQ9_9PEZI|nr:putative chromatin remodeling complex subunit [Diplodia seriata]
MPPFKDEQLIIIAPGSHTTLAQLGLPESLTPARLRIKSRMFAAEKEGEWEPYKVRRKDGVKPEASDAQNAASDDDVIYEEDHDSDEGAVWPMVEGRIVNWPCFFALMTHVYNALNPPFHTPILLVGQPAWTPKEKERLTQFFFEKFKMPAFTIMDSATAIAYAYGTQSATIVDVGYQKADVTAISDFIMHETGRAISVPDCGGDAMTQRLLELLKPKGLNREMCEQLKKNAICEILPPNTPLPGSGESGAEPPSNPAAAASTGATGSGPDGAATIGNGPRGPGVDTEVGEEAKEDEESEGVLDVASIVTSGKMNELLAKKEKEKQEKAAAKKKGADAAREAANKPGRLPNAKRERVTFLYEDHALLSALKDTTSVSAVDEVNKRSELWDSLIIVGNGAKVRGPMGGLHSHNTHSGHGQSPTSIKLVKAPEYFPEWKDVGMDEAVFLGAQVAAKVLFIVDQGLGQGYMTRTDYNDQGPSGIRDVCM